MPFLHKLHHFLKQHVRLKTYFSQGEYFEMQRLEEYHEKYKYTIVNFVTSLILEARSLCYMGMAVKKSKVTRDNP